MNLISGNVVDISVSKESVTYKSDNAIQSVKTGFSNNLAYPLFSAQIAAEEALKLYKVKEENATLVKVDNENWKLLIKVDVNDY